MLSKEKHRVTTTPCWLEWWVVKSFIFLGASFNCQSKLSKLPQQCTLEKTHENGKKKLLVSLKDDLRGTRHYTHSCAVLHYSRQWVNTNFWHENNLMLPAMKKLFSGAPSKSKEGCANVLNLLMYAISGVPRRNTKKNVKVSDNVSHSLFG